MSWMNSLKQFKIKALKPYARDRGKYGMIYILKKGLVLVLTANLRLCISSSIYFFKIINCYFLFFIFYFLFFVVDIIIIRKID